MAYKMVRDRLARIEHIATLRRDHPDWDEQRIIDEICVTTGVRATRVQEYIELLKRTGRWTP
jgi:hypothetical protein